MLLLSIGQLGHGVISLHMYGEIVAYLQEIKWPTLFTVAVFCLNLVAVVLWANILCQNWPEIMVFKDHWGSFKLIGQPQKQEALSWLGIWMQN